MRNEYLVNIGRVMYSDTIIQYEFLLAIAISGGYLLIHLIKFA